MACPGSNSIDLDLPILPQKKKNTLRLSKLHVSTHYILLQQAGFNQSDYSSHKFRMGAATTAAAAGIPTWLIIN